MATYITIDGGTTNTRISLVEDLKVIDTLKFGVGARAGIDDKKILENTVKNGIIEILKNNKKTETDITRILASGMITSEFGLCQLDHITAPAGIKELNEKMHEVILENISKIPFVFIRGVKTACSVLSDADMMRGEETELMGISQGGEGTYILPGSHSKIIRTDKDGRILTFSTMLTGEMAASLSANTILKDAVDFKNTKTDEEYLLKGYEYCSEKGINEALFKVRILKNIFKENADRVYSFFMGIILCNEINFVLKENPPKIVIGGKKQIKEAMEVILKKKCNSEIILASDDIVDSSSSIGMIKVFEYK